MRYSAAFSKNSSRILLGTAYFGETVSPKTAFALLDLFCEHGGTHIDTARLYANGKAEKLIGQWRKDRRATEMLISTKGGYPTADDPDRVRLSARELRSDLEQSLSALAVDVIDFYWLHRDDEARPVGELVELLNAFQKEGKIRAFGASNWTAARIQAANDYAAAHGLTGFSAAQMRFNPAVKNETAKRTGLVGMDGTQMAYYRKAGLPVVAYSPQAKGFFSKVAADAPLPDKTKARYLNDQNLQTAALIRKLAEKHGVSEAAIVCGAFCSFATPEVFPIIGCQNPTQLLDSLSGADVALTAEELTEIFRFVL